MKILSKLIFMILTFIGFNFSTACATEFEKVETAVHLQRLKSQFDPGLAKEYIEEEKKEARKQGFEEGRIEEDKSIALKMLADGIKYEYIVKYTRLTMEQVKELKTSLRSYQ